MEEQFKKDLQKQLHSFRMEWEKTKDLLRDGFKQLASDGEFVLDPEKICSIVTHWDDDAYGEPCEVTSIRIEDGDVIFKLNGGEYEDCFELLAIGELADLMEEILKN